jgi:hypothetical protein
MFKRKTKTIFSVILIAFLLVSSSTSAYAYNLCGYEWSSSSIKYYYDSYPSTRFKTYIGLGASAWNSTSMHASLTNQYPNGAYCAETSNPNATWDGISYVSWDANGYVTSASIVLNTAVTQTWNNDAALKSVAVHEFGHILSLDENGTSQYIMNDCTWGAYSRYGTYKLTTPQSMDVTGVNQIY